MARDFAIDINAGDDKRAEEISFPALVDPEMRFEHLGLKHLLIPDSSLFQDFWLKIKPDEIFGVFTLNDYFRSLFVHGDDSFAFCAKKIV